MHLSHLALFDIRNHQATTVALNPGATVITGANAQGKTNILEAIHYLGVGRSHRTSIDRALIRVGADRGVIRASAHGDQGNAFTVSLEFNPGRMRASVNDAVLPQVRDAIGLIRMVMLAPEDLNLVHGGPGDRRLFLDTLLASRRASFRGVAQDAASALKQRNAILKDGRGGSIQGDVLAAYTQTWLSHAALVTAARIAAVHALAEPLAQAYADLVAASPNQDVHRLPRLSYVLAHGRVIDAAPGTPIPDPEEIRSELAEALVQSADEERRRGMTLVGPHRDELGLWIGDLPAKAFASHGEVWSLALSLKLATVDVIAETGDQPILLLDDVFAELDQRRAKRLALRCKAFDQVVITVAEGTPVPIDGDRITVENGAIL